MKIVHFIYLLAFAFFVQACGGPKTVSSGSKQKSSAASKGEQELPISFSDKRRLDAAFSDGLIQKLQGNYPEAIDHFKRALDIYPNHAASHYEMAFVRSSMGRLAEALPYAEKAVSLEPQNEWYRLLLSKTLMDVGKFAESSASFRELVNLKPGNIEYYFLWSSALLHAGKIKEAMEVYDKIEGMIGISEELSLQKQRIYLSQNQTDKAIMEAEKLIRSQPDNPQYRLVLAELYFQMQQDEKAIEVCNKIFEKFPNEPETHLLLAKYYENTGKNQQAFTHVVKAFENPELDIDEKVKILVQYFNIPNTFKEETAEAAKLIEILIETHPTDPRSYSLQGDFLTRDGKNQEARDAFRKALSYDKSKYPIWQQVMVLDEALNDFESMEKDSKEAMELFPAEPYTYVFNASANYQLKKYEESVKVLEAGKDYVAGDKKLLAQFYSMMGDSYHGLKDNAKSDEKYEKSLNLDPDNAIVLNNWAYYLSLRKENLDKAERMSRKSNQLVKDNPSYEDTYAWILYQQQNFEEAKKWQERALQHTPGVNGTLLEHYGDILFQLGQKDAALEYWLKAKESGKYSELLLKKINDKTLYE